MCAPRCRRCWPLWALTCAGWFAYLERLGYRGRNHRTLSRELDALGRPVAWSFTAAGLAMTVHLLTLPELEQVEPTIEEQP